MENKLKVWPYDRGRIMENKAGREGITEKQINYIKLLSKDREDVLESIINSIYDKSCNDISLLSKGHGMYVIGCLTGGIKQVTVSKILWDIVGAIVESDDLVDTIKLLINNFLRFIGCEKTADDLFIFKIDYYDNDLREARINKIYDTITGDYKIAQSLYCEVVNGEREKPCWWDDKKTLDIDDYVFPFVLVEPNLDYKNSGEVILIAKALSHLTDNFKSENEYGE